MSIILRKTILAVFLLFISSFSFSQSDFFFALADSAITLTKHQVKYDPQYVRIKYPGGDVPAGTGVCTDVIIRTYRKMGIDLQKKVHEDMVQHFSVYPKGFGLKKTDSNIDHRRVPNLMTFFKRHGTVKKISIDNKEYAPGDLVTWDLLGGATHIGIVINKKSSDGKRYLVVHNIGYGQEISDCLFTYKIIGHYSYK